MVDGAAAADGVATAVVGGEDGEHAGGGALLLAVALAEHGAQRLGAARLLHRLRPLLAFCEVQEEQSSIAAVGGARSWGADDFAGGGALFLQAL